MNYRIIIIVVFFAGSIAASYFASEPLYRCYLQFWYRDVQKTTPGEMEKKARQLLEKKEFEALSRYLDRMTVVYRHNSRVLAVAGLYYLRMKERARGAELLAASLEGDALKGKELREAVSLLFEEKYYGDVEAALRQRGPLDDPDLFYYYGVSLLKIKKYPEAVTALKKACGSGYHDADSLLYLSKALVHSGDVKGAEGYLEMAHRKSPYNYDVISALVDVYRRQGKLKKAAAVMIRRRKKE